MKNLLNWADRDEERGYREVASVNGLNSDWITAGTTEDSDIWQNIFQLRARMRDLWKTNPYFSKYRELLASNIFGEAGIMLRMKVMETEDRVVHTPDERLFLDGYHSRREAIFRIAAEKAGRPYCREFDPVRMATIKAGEQDLYANGVIERAWKRWQRAEFCDARGQRDYSILRQLRLWACARDGDHFIRMVRDPSLKPFGFTLQMINSEWCDYFLNHTLDNGNEIRMGIEYEFKSWGLGKPVAYHFIRRMPKDWQWTVPGQGYNYSPQHYDRIPANEIIHVARFTDTDGTRPAPWGASTIGKSRGLDQFELAEVFAARAAACKTGWAYSDLTPEGGSLVGNPDPTTAIRNLRVEPGGIYGLPWGVKMQEVSPTHPNQNFSAFRQGMLQSWCAGMPGADYNMVANDLANISFSSGRLGRLDMNEGAKIIQEWDICTSEVRIFENFLEMALAMRAIPLPLVKYEKYNRPVFQGRRWRQVDEVKEITAASLRIANGLSSRAQESAEMGSDWYETAMELKQEEAFAEKIGLDITPTTKPPAPVEPDEDDKEEDPKSKGNGNGTNGKSATTPEAEAAAVDLLHTRP